MEQGSSWEANKFLASPGFPRILWNRKVYCRVKGTRFLSLSWAREIQCVPSHSTCLKPTVVLSSRLRLDLPRSLLSSCFPTKTLYVFLLSLS